MKVLFFLLFLISLNSFSQDYKGSILRVIDGDTFIFQTSEGTFKVRMFGIDAPEKSQEFGKESKTFLIKYTNKPAVLKKISIDKYGRTLGVLFIDNQNINVLSIKNGYSWHYSYYCKDKIYHDAEQSARALKVGIWKFSHPTPPWEYRKAHPSFSN